MLFTPETVASLQRQLLLDLQRLAPELVLVGTIVGLLVVRMFSPKFHLGVLALAGAMTAAGAWAGPRLGLWPDAPPGPAFSGLLQLDEFAHFLRGLLSLFLVLLVVLTRLTGLPDAEDAADFYALAFGLILGLMLMTSANHFLTIFLSVEMASLPGYALAGFLKGRRAAGEAAMKYVIYGAAASGVMLYGFSLLAVSGVGMSGPAAGAGATPLVGFGWLFVAAGLLFKLAAVPLHVWLPDVLEGSAAEVGAILATASKVGAVGLIARVLLAAPPTEVTRYGLILVAALTMTLGNLLALRQTDLKRLLAYSTVAHAGTILMALSTLRAGASLKLYLAAYTLMNLGAFAVVALVRNATGSEAVDAVRGLGRRAPLVAVGFAACLFSLLGLPPLAGFVAKFVVFQETYECGAGFLATRPTLAFAYLALLAVGVLNTVLSAGYYLKLLRLAFFEEPTDARPVAGGGYVALLAAGLLVLGLAWAVIV